MRARKSNLKSAKIARKSNLKLAKTARKSNLIASQLQQSRKEKQHKSQFFAILGGFCYFTLILPEEGEERPKT